MSQLPSVRRGWDILLSLSILLCTLPLLVILCVWIRCDSPGPALYCSKRIGYKGRLFNCWKLRSMYGDAEERLDHLLTQEPLLRREWELYAKLKNDPRLTPIGRFVRSTSCDELPQLWNVLMGDLSIIGPRPYLPRELSKIRQLLGEKTKILFSVRPGLTGLWQTSGRSHLTFAQRVHLELSYATGRSWLLDLRLIAKTIPALLSKKGAF